MKFETNEFLKRVILRIRPHRDALETDVIIIIHNNSNNNIDDDDDGEDENYSITFRANYNT